MQDEPHGEATQKPYAVRPISEDEAKRFERSLAYMRKHFRTADLTDVAAHAGLSPFHFHRRFTLWAGRTPKAVLTEFQLEHARTLILAGGVGLPEVAARCGFANQSHLTHRFGLFHGFSPARWRKAQQRGARDADAGSSKAAA